MKEWHCAYQIVWLLCVTIDVIVFVGVVCFVYWVYR